jgi:hypothetical protein
MLTLILAASLLAVGIVPARGEGATEPLAAFRWQNRVLLMFGDGDRVGEQERRMDAHRAALEERDLVILSVVGDIVSDNVVRTGLPSAAALRARYRIRASEPLTVILVGKDGGEKLRETALVDPDTIFALIDTMPMRQNEARGDD